MIQSSTTAQFDCGSGAPGQARRAVAHALEGPTSVGRFPDAELVVSELITNAVLHTRCDHVRLDIGLHHDGRLRLAVVDADPGQLPVRCPSPGEDGGRGMRIVDAVAFDWGVEVTGTAKVVWVELHSTSDCPADLGVGN